MHPFRHLAYVINRDRRQDAIKAEAAR